LKSFSFSEFQGLELDQQRESSHPSKKIKVWKLMFLVQAKLTIHWIVFIVMNVKKPIFENSSGFRWNKNSSD
jgi:hypothetical protein